MQYGVLCLLLHFKVKLNYLQMKTYRFYITVFLFVLSFNLFAQYENTSKNNRNNNRQQMPKENRWFAGGMIGGGFSTYNSFFNL